MFSWLRALFRRRRFENEMRSELDLHIELYVDDLVKRGVPLAEAERRARAEFGSVEGAKEDCREASGLWWFDELGRNLRYAVRVLRKSPAFTITAVATLGLCIGANTAIFSVVDAVLLRPLPYPEPHELAKVATRFLRQGTEGDRLSQTGRTFEVLKENASAVDLAARGAGWTGVNFAAREAVEHVGQRRVSAGFFRVLGIEPFLGREFTEDEDRPGGPAVTILSHSLWSRVFGEDPSVVGQPVMLRGEPYTIVGVMPPGFEGNVAAALWSPLRPSTKGEGSGQNYGVIARVAPGATWAQAQSEIGLIGRAAVAEMELPADVTAELRLVPLQEGITGDLRQTLLLLWAAVGFVLLIGCINIAGVLMARAAGRAREVATRMALGGGRGSILRQLLTESLLLAVLGGFAGLAIGYAGVQAIQTLARGDIGIWQTIRLDERVLLVTMAATLVTGILFGLLPALQASRLDIRPTLAESGARGVAGFRSHWPRRMLVIAEVAIGVVLLAGAGVLTRSAVHLYGLDPGFDPTNVVAASLSLQDARYTTGESANRLFDGSLERIRALPGVESAAVALTPPFKRPLNMPFQAMEGALAKRGRLITNLTYVTPEYFEALRIPLLRGRTFRGSDTAESAKVVILSRGFVDEYYSNEDPLGRHIAFGGSEPREIVGIVGNVLQTPAGGTFAPLATPPAAFIPASQTSGKFLELVHMWFAPHWIVRTRGSDAGVIEGMQAAVRAVDQQLPFAGFASMGDIRWRVLSRGRFLATLFGALAALALLLAAIGVYGLIAHSVVERTRELGIRIALGATWQRAMRTAALPGVALAVAGIVIGVSVALLASPLLKAFVWGVQPGDPTTLAGVAAGLLLVSAVASFVPALRIARLDPARTLREE